jgi:hypothetical protein
MEAFYIKLKIKNRNLDKSSKKEIEKIDDLSRIGLKPSNNEIN